MDELLTITILNRTSLPVVSNLVPMSSLVCGLLSTAVPFTCGRAMGSLGSEVAAQIVLLKFYQFSSLCIVNLIIVINRPILVNFGSFLLKPGVREGVLAFHFTFICEGRFGHVFREMVFC